MTYLFNMKFESVKFLSRSFEAYFSDYGNDFNVSSFFAVCSKQIGEFSLTKLNVGSPLVLGVLGVQALPVHLSRPNNRQAKINYFLRKKYYRVNHYHAMQNCISAMDPLTVIHAVSLQLALIFDMRRSERMGFTKQALDFPQRHVPVSNLLPLLQPDILLRS